MPKFNKTGGIVPKRIDGVKKNGGLPGKQVDFACLVSYVDCSHIHLTLGMFEGVLGIIANGAVTMVLWYGAKLMYEGHVSAGVLTCKYINQDWFLLTLFFLLFSSITIISS